MPLTAPPEVAADQARFLGNYTRRYNAGAFAHPLASELAAHPENVTDERAGEERAVVVHKRLARESRRTDFTGGTFVIPAGSRVATHVAHTPNYLPDLSGFTHVMAYAEDHELSGMLAALGKRIVGSRVTSAAEVIHCWGPAAHAVTYPAWDRATVTDVGLRFSESFRAQAEAEVARVRGWDDDFPYYSDGSWSAVCLKGFWPEEPGRGVKPAEMPRTWKAEHKEDLRRTAQWTVLADELPALTSFVKSVPWWRQTERVRLLRMDTGHLGRHTDITDRAGGTRDGQIVRFHIPLITDPAIQMSTWDLDGRQRDLHLKQWHCYYLDARKPHAVTNPTPLSRVHLVADVVADAEVRSAIARSYFPAAS